MDHRVYRPLHAADQRLVLHRRAHLDDRFGLTPWMRALALLPIPGLPVGARSPRPTNR